MYLSRRSALRVNKRRPTNPWMSLLNAHWQLSLALPR